MEEFYFKLTVDLVYVLNCTSTKSLNEYVTKRRNNFTEGSTNPSLYAIKIRCKLAAACSSLHIFMKVN